MRVIRLAAAAAAVASFICGQASADALSTNFESFSIGQLPGGGDARMPGNAATWYVPDNAATFGEVRAGVGLGGSNGLVIGNRGNGNDGVVDNVKSGKLAQQAGEPDIGSPNSTFQSSFWFRTAASTPVAGLDFKTETWGQDRTTWLEFYDNGTGNGTGGLGIYGVGYDATGTEVDSDLSQTLDYGTWYNVVTTIQFVNGDGNDIVTQAIYDTTNTLITSFTNSTWEGYFDNYASGTFGVDAIGFQTRGSPAGDTVYVDNVSWSSFNANAAAVPEPEVLALLSIGALAWLGAARRRRRG
jgi:hypothetical protein